MSWAAEEFKGIDLGDKRLDKRAVLLAERLAEKPTASIAGVCGGWAETQAAYRFLAPHWACSQARMHEHAVVLCLPRHPRAQFQRPGPQRPGAAH
jgi:hypothetical protein